MEIVFVGKPKPRLSPPGRESKNSKLTEVKHSNYEVSLCLVIGVWPLDSNLGGVMDLFGKFRKTSQVHCPSSRPTHLFLAGTNLLLHGPIVVPQGRLSLLQGTCPKLGITENQVRNHLSYARNMLRQILQELIRDYVAQDSDVESELAMLLGG